MPNMDDIAFFDTEIYERRGGIWSDAGRESSTTFTSNEESPYPLVSLDTATTSSESTQKGDDASIQSAPAAMSAAPVEVQSSPTNLDDSLDSARSSTRRRTWFSSTTTEETDSSTFNLVLGSSSVKPEDYTQESGLPSSDCQPKPSLATNDVTERTSEREIPLTTTRSTSSRRSVSQYSIEVSQNLVDQEVHKPIPIPQKSSEASIPVPSPSPPSFFNTLKARAADKQALKETAKETIRKWGVNWAGFRKDINPVNPGPSDDNSEDTNQLQPEGDSTTTQKSRTSYAEVRAAVVERKGREKASQLLDHGSEPSSLSPETPRSRTQSTSLSPDASSTTPEASSTVALARAPSPSTRKPINMEKGVQDQDISSEESVKPTPIHVQPVAKTMSIPRIHASHRGEVQSMGYVAMQPQLSVSSEPMSGTVLKNPAIQTVYRFLKPNSDHKQEVLDHNPSHPFGNSSRTSLLDSTEVFNDQASEVLVLPTVTPSQVMVKPKPPPLPPRTAQQESSLPPFGSSGLDMDKGTQMNDSNSTVGFAIQEPVSEASSSVPTVPMPPIDLEPSRTDVEQTGTTFVAENRIPPPLPPRRTPVLQVSNP